MDRSPKWKTLSDAELLAAYRDGEARAFEVLFERHSGSVYAFAYRFCGDHDLAEDVVQECFRDLVDRIDRFQLRGSLSSWFYVVAKRRALRLKERTRREPAMSGGFDTDSGAALTALTIDSPPGEDSVEDLRRVLKRLPGPQQETLVLRYLDGFSLEEISDILEVPLGTVKSRIHNGLRALEQDAVCRRYFER